MGSFIAALRKANGLTQKDLAEKLSVSDKTVSRWERDEGMPDLSLVPVIAEIFDITADELLRGERKSATEPPAQGESIRTDKQFKRVLTASLSRYKNRSFIAVGLICSGLIAALIGNFAFLRGYIGFFSGSLFFLGGVITQLVFTNTAFLSVSDEDFEGEAIGVHKRTLVLIAEKVIGLAFVLFAATLPLLLLLKDAYVGMGAKSFLSYGFLFGGGALILWSVSVYFVNHILLKNGVFILSDKAASVYYRNFSFKRTGALILMGVLILTLAVHNTATGGWYAGNLAERTAFYDFESFKAFIEQDVPATHDPYGVVLKPDSAMEYYDTDGNPLGEDEARTRTVRDPEGNVIGSYIARNESASVRFSFYDGKLQYPITVTTRDQILAAQQKIDHLNVVFTMIYVVEAAGVILFYFTRRA